MGNIDVRPLTRDRWGDLETLFGANGAYSGCWCMWWRLTNREFDDLHADGRRDLFRDLVEEGREPGLLAYDDDHPVGWVCVGPRTEFGRALRSPVVKPDDPEDPSVWSVVCFYVPRENRGRGLLDPLLEGAVEHARSRGAATVEGYPVLPEGTETPSLYHGVPSVFARAGFTEVAAPTPKRRLMRLGL